MQLAGKVALVTGASRGIGQAVAMRLGQEGAVVIGTATREEGAASINEQFRSAGIQGMGLVLDVNVAQGMEQLHDTIKAHFDPPSILVNNAGITQDNLVLRMKRSEWDNVIATNLTSIFQLTKLFIKDMIKSRWGRVISVSSVSGITGNPGQANYAAAKAGVIGFSKALALELAVREVTVNVVAPGLVETDMTRKLTEEQRAHMLARVPMSRMATPEEVAHAVCFLASPLAGYMTGQTLHVNGGMVMV